MQLRHMKKQRIYILLSLVQMEQKRIFHDINLHAYLAGLVKQKNLQV